MKPARGVTLIELLVSITIGLVILLAIGLAYLNSTNLTRQRDNQSELNEPARMVMRMLQRDISMAGYVDVFDADTATGQPQAGSLFVNGNDALLNFYVRSTALPVGTPISLFFPGLTPIFGCDGAMSGAPNTISTTAGAASLACGAASTTRHTLQLAYQSAPSATTTTFRSLLDPAAAAAAAAGEGRDCNQQSLTAAGGREAKFVINRYYVASNGADGVNELYCAGSGNATPQPLARGVEEFVLRYQMAAPGTVPAPGARWSVAPNAQQQYASAATVAASTLGWANVTAVEVCMVLATTSSGGAAASGTAALQPTRPTCERETSGANIGLFKAPVAMADGDLRLWKRFTFITTARNAIYATPL